ncbi:unnamed protein product [Taenia asiatica]|uniref:Arp2/3 complex 34 kDa subunit n=1 Tax=Taenia asiatica TaxID=60517 RepID=A0A0R3WFV0_TAEAS|nr:unnamed protein product [Taenia asiatica]
MSLDHCRHIRLAALLDEFISSAVGLSEDARNLSYSNAVSGSPGQRLVARSHNELFRYQVVFKVPNHCKDGEQFAFRRTFLSHFFVEPDTGVPSVFFVVFVHLSVSVEELSGQRLFSLINGQVGENRAAVVDVGVDCDSYVYCCQEELLQKSVEEQRDSLPLRI